MKIAVLSNVSRNAGGLFYSVRNLSKAVYAQGTDCLIISDTDQYTMADRGVWDPLPLHFYRGITPLRWSHRLACELRDPSIELVHLHGLWAWKQFASLRWQQRTGKPVVISPRGMLDHWALNNSGWKKQIIGKWFANKSLRQASVLHALCQSEYESMRAYGLRNPIAIIPNGFDLPNIQPVEATPGGKRKLLFVSRIHPKKGLINLLTAWKNAGKILADWQLLLIGWDQGGHENELMELCKKLDLSYVEERTEGEFNLQLDASVVFGGARFAKDKDFLMQHADGFILPSFSEGLPMAVLEAWAYRLPAIITPQCNIPEGFAANAAVQINPNVESIVSGLTEFVSMSEEKRRMMGENGLSMVKNDFSWTLIGQKMNEVYRWCLAGGTPPDCIHFQ